MKIKEALKTIAEKHPILKEPANKAITDQDYRILFVDEILSQYYEEELNGEEKQSNKSRMDRLFGEDVMNCLIKYAAKVNYWAEIKLAELQSLEGFFSQN